MYDGKRCRETGFRPDRFCEPALREALSAPTPSTGVDLARAVLLFWAPGRWNDDLQATWCQVTGTPDDGTAKSVVLVRMAIAILNAAGELS